MRCICWKTKTLTRPKADVLPTPPLGEMVDDDDVVASELIESPEDGAADQSCSACEKNHVARSFAWGVGGGGKGMEMAGMTSW